MSSQTNEARRWRLASGLLYGFLFGLLFPGLARAVESKRESLERGCESCHKEIAAEWRGSFHRQAYSDVDYQAALLREPRPFCRGCHAPEADARIPATGWAARSGIACVTCHLRGDEIVTGPGPHVERARVAPHAISRHADFSTRVCQPCHEFDFPDARLRLRPESMQSTMSEHRALDTKESCADCHMARLRGRRTHRFPGGHDAPLVRGAVTVEATRQGGAIDITLTPTGTGHFVPTGDLFRRLLIETEGVATDGHPVRAARALQRHFGMEQQTPGAWVKVAERDDRLREKAVVRLVLDAAMAARPVRWRVRYQRVAHPLGQPLNAVLDGEIIIAEGILSPQRLTLLPGN